MLKRASEQRGSLASFSKNLYPSGAMELLGHLARLYSALHRSLLYFYGIVSYALIMRGQGAFLYLEEVLGRSEQEENETYGGSGRSGSCKASSIKELETLILTL
ncbi:unnamed protein product [Cuscuta epithymum]|uniref:Uncharacterized protein n=1 Tax=Cuscuta epithymum TaxID=186058 RepID=A0AAV0EAU3_9ASTE|nr:unnamed protein product [Cuscuta epithymum]